MIQSMRDIITFTSLMKEISFIFDIYLPIPAVFCKVFEDNQSCIVVAELRKFPPGTKHIDIKYHYLQSFLQKKIIWVFYIYRREQASDIFTMLLDKALFVYLRRKLSVW